MNEFVETSDYGSWPMLPADLMHLWTTAPHTEGALTILWPLIRYTWAEGIRHDDRATRVSHGGQGVEEIRQQHTPKLAADVFQQALMVILDDTTCMHDVKKPQSTPNLWHPLRGGILEPSWKTCTRQLGVF